MNFLALHPNLRIRIGVGFVNRLIDSMITAFMAIYLATRYSPALAGVLMLVVVTLGVGGMLLGGHLADTWGRRGTLLVAEAVGALTFGVMAAANADWWSSTLVVYLAYLVNKFAGSIALPANDSMIIDVTTPADRKDAYTINYWATNLAIACGGLFGGFFYNGHFTAMLAIAATCLLGVLATTWFFLAETKPATADTGVPVTKTSVFTDFAVGYRLVLKDGTFLRFMLAATLGLAIEFQLVNYLGVRFATELPVQRLIPFVGWTPQVTGVEMLGILRAENTVLVVVLALFSHLLFKRLSDRFRLYGGIALFAGGYMVMAVSDVGWLLLVAGVVFTVGELMNVPIKQTLLANMVPGESRTRYMAVYNLNIRVAQMIASLCITLGAVLPGWGMAALYGLLGVVIMLQYRVVLARAATRGSAADEPPTASPDQTPAPTPGTADRAAASPACPSR